MLAGVYTDLLLSFSTLMIVTRQRQPSLFSNTTLCPTLGVTVRLGIRREPRVFASMDILAPKGIMPTAFMQSF
jgi:hypothetical protein